MAADPYEIFAGGSDTRRKMLEMGWPELYQALYRAVAAAKANRVRLCEIVTRHGGPGNIDRPPAVGRLAVNGRAACAECIAYFLPDRPGGFPLELTDPRKLR
jgi:hypothetical protein